MKWILLGLIAAACGGDVVPNRLPEGCRPIPDYVCPLCNVHWCSSGWGTNAGDLFECRPNDSPGFPTLSCFGVDREAAASCGCE